MQLPRGYYAVQADFEHAAKGCFTFRGVTYEVTVGVNVFATVLEAEAAIKQAGEPVPDTALEGVPYETFFAPVLLFSAGEHRIDRYEFGGSRIMLGEGVGITPNLPVSAPDALPELNTARAEEAKESVLYGGYTYGVLSVRKNEVTQVLIDGLTFKKTRFFDYRTAGACDFCVKLRNIVHIGTDSHITYYFASPRADSGIHREVRFENSRIEHYDDMEQGGVFLYANARLTVFDGFCCNGTTQVFGFTDIARTRSNCTPNSDVTDIVIRNSHFRDLTGDNGISTQCHNAGHRAVNFTVTDSVFYNASRENEAVLHPHLVNDRCELRVTGCHFVDTRGNKAPAVMTRGVGENILIEDCTVSGFSSLLGKAPTIPTEAPDHIEGRDTVWTTSAEDPHEVIPHNGADFEAMDSFYEGYRVYYGDQHCHSSCGGRSDGKFPLKDWVGEMDRLGLDFAAIVDHHQMRGFFLPEWSEERFIMGSEPGSKLLNPGGVLKKETFHYNMLVPHRYGLAMVLANFPEFEFHGDELTGSFEYPPFTRERIQELNDYLLSIGGALVHAHPMALMGSSDPLDYYFGEHSHLEVMVGAYHGMRSFKSYDLWVKILNLGKHMFAAGGSDTHSNVTNACVSTFYARERRGEEFLSRMRTGDYTAGAVGIKMMIDGHPMGSELSYREGMRLTLRVGDFFAPVLKDNTAYELRVYTDRGLAYASMFNGRYPQGLTLSVKERKYYRAEIADLTHGYRIAVGNPIWLDRTEQTGSDGL